MTVWADVAGRYREPRELRTAGLKARFMAHFEGGELKLQLATGVIRAVKHPEFSSAWAILQQGGPAKALRLVTSSGQYLEAVRRDLLDAGLGHGDVGTDDDVDMGTLAAILVEEATTRSSRPAASAAGTEARLRTALLERDELVRELAEVKAALQVTEERLAAEARRAEHLEAAVAHPVSRAAIGTRTDPTSGFAAFVESELRASGAQLNPLIAAGIRKACDIALQDPDLALVQCRKVAEALAQNQYLSITGASEAPKYATAIDLMEQIRDRDGVDMVLWNLHRNIFRVTNPSAHLLREAGSRQFALTVAAMVLVVATHTRPNEVSK